MEPSKFCKTCLMEKPLSGFYRASKAADGHHAECKACQHERTRRWRAANAAGKLLAHKEAARKRAKAYYYANHEVEKAKRTEFSRRRRAEHPGPGRKPARPGAKAEAVAWRRAMLKSATPAWVDRNAIRAIYRQAKEADRLTGTRHHVDHIVPLVHPLVCGLHVPANLQVLHYLANHAKSNRVWPDMPDLDPVPALVIDERLLEPETFADGA